MFKKWWARVYLRGISPLGILNTVCGILFNRVLVHIINTDTREHIAWRWDKADNWPRGGGI